MINEENKLGPSLVYRSVITLDQNLKAGKLLLYVMGRKLPTSADGISTTATEIYLLMFTKEILHLVMAIHISDSVVFYILIFLVARISNFTVLLETDVGNQKNISS